MFNRHECTNDYPPHLKTFVHSWLKYPAAVLHEVEVLSSLNMSNILKHHCFHFSKINCTIIQKHAKPPPSNTPPVAPQTVAKPLGSTSCHGIRWKKKSGVRLPAANPNVPPSTIPISAPAVTLRKILVHFIMGDYSSLLIFRFFIITVLS